MPRLLLLRGRPSSWVPKTEEMVQGKVTLNKNQSLTCRCWWHGLMFFLHRFQCFVLLLLLYHSGKLAIPHYHMFLLLQIMHLVLFKSLQHQGEMSIYGDSCVVFWWAIDGNLHLSFMKRADVLFVQNRFVAIYFWPISVRQLRKNFLLVLKQYVDYCVVISGRWTPFNISGCAIDLVDGSQCRVEFNFRANPN